MSGEPLDLDAIEARANAAMPGPWAITRVSEESDYEGPAIGKVDSVGPIYPDSWDGLSWLGGSPEDHEFIAHARTDVTALVAELRAARARIAALEATIAASETVEMLRAALPRDV